MTKDTNCKIQTRYYWGHNAERDKFIEKWLEEKPTSEQLKVLDNV